MFSYVKVCRSTNEKDASLKDEICFFFVNFGARLAQRLLLDDLCVNGCHTVHLHMLGCKMVETSHKKLRKTSSISGVFPCFSEKQSPYVCPYFVRKKEAW